ncbi:hypothetical protein [Companilactobacillus mishanensis]|uniref:Uncharacterized protein n=1 Tax=Companilactobacillus mishanensis TaxID=2486008 RepID=A0A5P0ZES2_9LACO|nr:hypothetical protein [Companilactobacillus mishanensis]MQS51544.1 hypothetical protein [Companilactobacillus mishanensis]
MLNPKFNHITALTDIISCLVFSSAWLFMFHSSFNKNFLSETFQISPIWILFYVLAGMGFLINTFQMDRHKDCHITKIGPILGMTGNGIFLLSPSFAFPAILILLVAIVFTLIKEPLKKQLNLNEDK